LKVRAEERDEAVQLSNRTIEEKNQLETTMYSQFLRVLNEKKDKIRELENKVAMYRKERDESKKKLQDYEKEAKRMTIVEIDEVTGPVTPHKRTINIDETPMKRY
jgi:uncharacterized protein YlxW (UPF0749 family)